MSNSHRLALIAAQKVFSYLLSLGPNDEKSQVHQMTPNDLQLKKAKGTVYTHESQILLRFALRSPVFQRIEVFDFSTGEFKIFEK